MEKCESYYHVRSVPSATIQGYGSKDWQIVDVRFGWSGDKPNLFQRIAGGRVVVTFHCQGTVDYTHQLAEDVCKLMNERDPYREVDTVLLIGTTEDGAITGPCQAVPIKEFLR